LGFLGVGAKIVKNESFWALYKGLGAVVSGIVPKMAIRFSSFELYKSWMADEHGIVSTSSVFVAGLAAGTTEAVLVVSPMDLIKIRLQVKSGEEYYAVLIRVLKFTYNNRPRDILWLIPWIFLSIVMRLMQLILSLRKKV
jgi:hypothetical protein